MNTSETTATKEKDQNAAPVIKPEAQTDLDTITREEVMDRLLNQKAHFAQTIQRRRKNLFALKHAAAALESHIDDLDHVAASNEKLISEIEDDLRAVKISANKSNKRKKRGVGPRAR
ncbi:hypothetical protein N7475_000467 [Penicillium sp. IBT 31633x]|nr:hypothetical protein N7475_000467 [Penicillium sp. IBT 31633x]